MHTKDFSQEAERLQEPQLTHISAFNVTGLHVKTINRDEFNPATAKLPNLWQRFFSEDLVNTLSLGAAPDSPIFGVYSDYESNADGCYTVTAGMQTDRSNSEVPLHKVKVLSGNYLVFENQGAMPQAVIEAWQNIWHFFETHTEVTRAFKTDFEMYRGETDIAIYIGIQT